MNYELWVLSSGNLLGSIMWAPFIMTLNDSSDTIFTT